MMKKQYYIFVPVKTEWIVLMTELDLCCSVEIEERLQTVKVNQKDSDGPT